MNQPPKTLKTHLISVCFVAWRLGSSPGTKFAIICYDEALATRIVRLIRQIMRSAWYRALYPETMISGDKDSESYFETTFGGEVRAVSIQGGITGHGYDFIIIDDPMKASVAHSEAERRRLEENYSSAVANRWRDPTKGVLIVVMQRLHVDDFTAFLLRARPDTVHLKIPAVAPCDLEYEVGGGKRYIFREGELLEPDRLSHEFLQEMRALQGLAHYNSQYLQEPLVSGGRIIEPNWFRRFQAPRKHDYRVISIDPAFTQDGGDHSAAIICNFVGMDIEIIHAERVQLAFTGLVQWVRGLDQKWSPDAFVIEAIGTGRGFCDHLRHGLGMNHVHFVESHGPNDKVQRMELASPKVEAGRVWLPYFGEFVQPFLDEVVQFPFAPCDDWADALSQLVLYFEKIWERARRYHSAKFPPPPPPEPPRRWRSGLYYSREEWTW